jgi:hypothetical protein
MPQVNIPDDLFREIEDGGPQSVSPEQFVLDAVREKLAWQDRKGEFFRLSDKTRRAMLEKGISEEQMLEDFECYRASKP